MADQGAGVGAEAGVQGGPRVRLRTWVEEWRALDRQIEAVREWLGAPAAERGPQPPGIDQIQEMRKQRRNIRVDIMDLLDERPNLADYANNLGFTYKGFDEDLYAPGGPPGASAGASRDKDERGAGKEDDPPPKDPTDPPPPPPPPTLNKDDLLGNKGKNYEIVRTPKGGYMAVYKFRIGGQSFQIGLQIPKNKLGDYKIKEGEGKRLSREQMNRIQNIGWADELTKYMRQGDQHVIKSLVRYLNNQYEGQPILEDDEVMGTVIANSLFGWSAGEFENQLRGTKWYRNTDDYYRDWQTTFSPEKKRNAIGRTTETVIDELENLYGLDWMKHVEGGVKQAKAWAEKIASGQWGSPDAGFDWWRRRQFDKAAEVSGTPAWIENQTEQEERRGFMNRPEDMAETLRSDARKWLGPKFAPNSDVLMQWATDIVTEKKSDADWQKFLRRQTKALHGWKDENTAWQDVASSYRSIAEEVLRRPIEWDDPLLSRLGNDAGDAPLSSHQYELMVRGDKRAREKGTLLYDEALQISAGIQNAMAGVTY